MSLSRHQENHFYECASAVVDGTISDQQFEDLCVLLSSDRAVRSRYVEYMYQQAMLVRAFAAREPGGRSPQQLPPVNMAVLGTALPKARTASRISTIAATLMWATLLYGSFSFLVWQMSQYRGTNSTPGRAVAIISSEGAQWTKAAPANLAAPQLLPGELLQIDSGIVRLELSSGTALRVEGPAALSIAGDNQARLNFGRLLAIVPPRAIGFRLDTPMARIVDLGTEFVVEVHKSGAADVHVTKGLVDVRSLPGAELSGTGQLRAGQAARITTGRATVASAGPLPSKFKRLVEAEHQSSPAQATNRTVATRLLDLSKRGTVSGSSQIGPEYPAKNAIDGDLASCFHTDNDLTPWWQVDLGSVETIGVVVISSPPGTRLGRFRDLYIKVLAADGKTVVASSPLLNPKNRLGGGETDWWKGPAQLVFEPMRSEQGPIAGRFVRVERVPCEIEGSDNDRMVLSLSEVQLFEAVSDSKPAEAPRDRSE